MGLGPSPDTWRDVGNPRSWLGLSQADHRLLQVFMSELGAEPLELHTHVPVGCVPKLRGEAAEGVGQRMADTVLPRRVDAVLRFPSGWWLVECKPYARHFVLGQVLCYAYWWLRDLPHLPLVRVIVVTDEADEDVGEVVRASNVTLVELRERLGGTLPHAIRDRAVLSHG